MRKTSSTGEILTNEDVWRNYTVWWGSFNADDSNGSGIDHFEYQTNCEGDIKKLGNTYYTYTNGVNTSFCIRAVDKLDNYSDWSDPYYFRIDTQAPNVPTSSLSSNGYWMTGNMTGTNNNTQVNISYFYNPEDPNKGHSCSDIWWGNFQATDNGASGIDHFEYSTGCTGTKSNNLSSSYHYTTARNSDFCIRSVDNAGNVSAWSKKYHIELTFDPCKCGATSGCNSNAAAVCTSNTTYSNWSSCSSKCGSDGTKTRTKTTTTTCNKVTRTYTQTEKEKCNRTSCYKILDKSYNICPSDQKVPTKTVCKTRGYQYDSLEVQISKSSDTKVNVKATVGMNDYAVTWDGNCSSRRICIAPMDSQECKCEIGSFSAGSSGWLGTSKEKTYNKTCNVRNYSKGKYRVIVDDVDCTSTRFRFRSENKTAALEILY